MISLNGVSNSMLYGQGPVKQPSYKDEQIHQLKDQESQYQDQIAQLQGSDDEDSQEALQGLQNDLARVQEQLDSLKPITAVKPPEGPPPPPPPTDEEMNERFGSAYSVELSSAAQAATLG